MDQQFTEIDLECLIGKEWSLVGSNLRHEKDGLWLKDPSAIGAAERVDETGRAHEVWIHPTSTPTKPVLPFPFTMAQFKVFCDWHPTFEWEAITSVFTNDDDTVDDKNLAFMDSRSRAAGALVRYIIGKTDDEFAQAWIQHCAVDEVEAKIVELASLRPEKISEIQYRDARLEELRAELGHLKKGISNVPSAKTITTNAPVLTKRRTWRVVAWPYMQEVFKSGQYATAKQFYRALEKKAGPDSPFEIGKGQNLGSLFVSEIGETLTFKTFQNIAWPKLKNRR